MIQDPSITAEMSRYAHFIRPERGRWQRVLVNLLLAVLSASSGRGWAIYPALGWGLGLAIHGAVVFMVTGGMMDRMVEHERRQLARDPW